MDNYAYPVISEVVLAILGLLQGPLGSPTYGMASLDVEEMECSCKFGLGKILEAPRHDLTTFQRCWRKYLYTGGVFSYFEALMGA